MKKNRFTKILATTLAIAGAVTIMPTTAYAVKSNGSEEPRETPAPIPESSNPELGKHDGAIGVGDDEGELPDILSSTTINFGTFENTYTAEPVYVAISGNKVLTDASKSGKVLTGNDFSFQLKDSKGDVVETVQNAADGKIQFSNLKFTTPGEYTYTIVEIKGTDSHIKYDESVKTVTVTVTGKDGVLTATAEKK